MALRTEPFVINMGPVHPSTHGVFRMRMTLDGEVVVDVEPVFGPFQEPQGVGVVQLKAEILESAAVVVRQIPPAQLDYLSVDIHHNDPVHRTVGQHLTCGCALTATRDEDLPGVGMRNQAGVYQGLVVDELVHLRGLGLAV